MEDLEKNEVTKQDWIKPELKDLAITQTEVGGPTTTFEGHAGLTTPFSLS